MEKEFSQKMVENILDNIKTIRDMDMGLTDMLTETHMLDNGKNINMMVKEFIHTLTETHTLEIGKEKI